MIHFLITSVTVHRFSRTVTLAAVPVSFYRITGRHPLCQSLTAISAAKCLTDRILTAICTGPVNIHLVGSTFAVFIVRASFSLAIHMNTAAAAASGHGIDRRTLGSVTEAVAAGFVCHSRFTATDADVTPGAKLILVVDTVRYHTV